MSVASCPCGSGRPEAHCCLPVIAGAAPAQSAEALMRSRYTAFALGHAGYLRDSWHASTRPATLDLAADARKWLGLTVRRHAVDKTDPDRAIVEFVARFRVAGRGHRLHEISRFVRESGRWFYLDGDIQGGT